MQLFDALSNGFDKENDLLFRHRLATRAAYMIKERALWVPRQDMYVSILLKVVADFEKVRVLSHFLQGLKAIHECRILLRLCICGYDIHCKEVISELMADNTPPAHCIVWEDVLHM